MKLVSILGDSVSTFQGYNPRGYSVFYDASMQRVNGLNSVSDTWWDMVIKSMHARLCVNNSYSGNRVTGENEGVYCYQYLRLSLPGRSSKHMA